MKQLSSEKELWKENQRLKEKIKELEKRISDAGWQYEHDHVDDWRKPIEMGQL